MEFPENHEAAQNILDSLRRIVRALRISSRLSEKNYGLSVTQLFVMQQLKRSERPLSMNELAQATLTHQSSVSVVVSRLVERRIVERVQSREDARRVEISLTLAGQKLLDSVMGALTVQDRLVSAIDKLGSDHGQTLAALLRELVTLSGFDETEPGMFEE